MSIKSAAINPLPGRVFDSPRVLKRPELSTPLMIVTCRQDGSATQHSADLMDGERFTRA